MTIKLDKRNYRVHNEENKKLIEKSLKECGAGRSILIDANNEIIAGNGVYEQAQKLKLPTRIIETDGKEIVAVKRTDLKTNDEKRTKLAILDNSTNDLSSFDIPMLEEDFDVATLNELGIPAVKIDENELQDFFTENEEKTLDKDKTIICPYCGKEIEL